MSSIAKALGGRVSVESEPGRGTTFRVYFPGLEGPVTTEPEALVPADSVVEVASSAILLVEDDPGVRSLTARILRARGYTVITARDAGQAVMMAESRAGSIHLLLTDVVLPGVSGPELAQQLTASNPAMKVLYISAYPYETLARRGVRLADIEFLEKPFTAQALTQRLREVLESNSKTLSIE